jgi:hypothetical protein
VVLRNNANLSTGGTATDVTDHVHPEVASRAVAGGADGRPRHLRRGRGLRGRAPVRWRSTGGGIVEVNAAPGLRMHLSPSYGKPRAVGEAIVDPMFPPGDDGRIPVVAVTGTNGKTTTVRLIAHLLADTGPARRHDQHRRRATSMASRSTAATAAGPKSARNVLMHPDVDAAVFETARGGILREGLGFDRCDGGSGDQHRGRRPPRTQLHRHGRGPVGGQARHRAERGSRWHGRAQRRGPPGGAHGGGESGTRHAVRPRPPGLAALAAHRARGERARPTVVDGAVVCIEREVVASFALGRHPARRWAAPSATRSTPKPQNPYNRIDEF